MGTLALRLFKMKKSKENNQNDVKEPTQTPSERRGDRVAVKIAEKVERIQQELINLRIRMYYGFIASTPMLEPHEYQSKLLNSEKKRREYRKEMLEYELAKANEQLILKTQLEQSNDC